MSHKSKDIEVKQFLDGDGNLIEEGRLKNGILYGKRRLWSLDGKKLAESDYHNG